MEMPEKITLHSSNHFIYNSRTSQCCIPSGLAPIESPFVPFMASIHNHRVISFIDFGNFRKNIEDRSSCQVLVVFEDG